MSTRLIQVVAFANVAPAATVNLPHQININGIQKRPDFIAADAAGFTVTATATQVSVTNTNDAPLSVNVWLELKHAIPRQLGALANLTPQPFVSSPGGGGGSPTIIIEDEGVVIPGNPFTNLNFAGAGVTVADGGGGTADITVPGGGNFPDIIDTPGEYVQIGDAPGAKTIIGIATAPNPADPQLRVRTSIPLGGEQIRVEDENGGHTTRFVTGGSSGGGYLETGKFRGSVWSYSSQGSLVPGATGTANNVPLSESWNDAQPGGAGVTITGFAPSALMLGSGVTLSGTLWAEVFNAGGGNITLAHENVGSDENNRIRLAGGVNLVIRPGGGWRMVRTSYPGVGLRWVIVGANP